MKKVIVLVLILAIVSCRKDLSGTDYGQLIGKYKLVYTLRYTTSTIDHINPSDDYEIDFNKNGKIFKYKNGHCESKEKVENCTITSGSTSGTYRSVHLFIKDRQYSVSMELPLYNNDTLEISGYYPTENDPNFNPYGYEHYYVKE